LRDPASRAYLAAAEGCRHSPRTSRVKYGLWIDELPGKIDDGVFIRDLIGFGQSNIINGDISCTVGLGFRIKNGEIVGRVKDTMIAGNLYELLAGNVQLSSDLDYTGRLPHAVVEGLAVSSK